MNAPEVSQDEAHRIDTTTDQCQRCGMSLDAILGLRLGVCSRILEIRERIDALNREEKEAHASGHSDWGD